MALKQIDGAWWTCGCGGQPRQRIALPPGTTQRVFTVKVAAYGKGKATGRNYLMKPHVIAVYSEQRDVEGFAEQSREPTPQELAGMAGYQATQGR